LLAVFGVWQTEGQLVIATELGEKTLLDRLQESIGQGGVGIEAEELLGYMAEAAEGIDLLNSGHEDQAGIQHRDIKPSNLLLVGGSVKVADFGLARLLDHDGADHSGRMTPAYAAPEFFDGRIAAQSDQYSLAVTYCQLRSGRLPFTGTAAELMAGHLNKEPDLTMLPECERPVVARALAKKPADRWPSCRAFVEALRTAAMQPSPLNVPRNTRRTRGILSAVGASIVLGGLVLAILSASRPNPSTTDIIANAGTTPVVEQKQTKTQPKTSTTGTPSTSLVQSYRQQIEATWPGLGSRLTMNKDGTCKLNLDNTQVKDLVPLRGLPLAELSLHGCQVKDLGPLEGMPLTSLNLTYCSQVRDLSPLRAMKLQSLWLRFCSQIKTLEPLRGTQLTDLDLHGCSGIDDLSPLEKMPLTSLNLSLCRGVKDLTPLREMKLTYLSVLFCDQIHDLTPLEGMPLQEIALTPRLIRNGMDALLRMTSLKTIAVDGGPQARFSAGEFWGQYERGEFGK
jgi:serine/threonine protein kinase